MTKLAVIRIKGQFAMKGVFRDTLDMMDLGRKNHCIIIDKTPSNMGMLQKVMDCITFGEISEETFSKLKKKKAPLKESKTKVVFALPNPKKGFKAIKRGYNEGGDLGYRGEKINELMERIIENIE